MKLFLCKNQNSLEMRKYLLNTLDSIYVASVGFYVNQFEYLICEQTGSKYFVVNVNETCDLHIVLIVANIELDEEITTRPLTLEETANAIQYTSTRVEQIDIFVKNKRSSVKEYNNFLSSQNIILRTENKYSRGNYWLMFIDLENITERDSFFSYTNKITINKLPIWSSMTNLPMSLTCQKEDLSNSKYLPEQIINTSGCVVM